MKPAMRKGLLALVAALVICLPLFITYAPSFAQSDADRSSRIREQIDNKSHRVIDEEDLTQLRDNLNLAIDALVKRIDKMDKDIIELKSHLRGIEVRTDVSGKMLPAIPSGSESKAGRPPKSNKSKIAYNSVASVSVCERGCDTAIIADAIRLVAEGGTITLEPGDYNQCARINKSLKLIGKISPNGDRAHLKKIACKGKGAINLQAAEVTIQGLKISDISVPDKNGACIRIAKPAVKITIRDIVCLDSENGILGRTVDEGVMSIEDSYFSGHGKVGKAHGIYINGGGDLILRNVKILNSDDGHLLKTGARSTLIENSIIAALGGNSGAAINAYGGGKLTVRNSVIQLGPNTQNHNFLSYADEAGRIVTGTEHAILIENNWFIYDDPARCCRWLFSKRSNILDKIDVRNNKFVSEIDPVMNRVDMRANITYENREKAGLGIYDGTITSLPAPGH